MTKSQINNISRLMIELSFIVLVYSWFENILLKLLFTLLAWFFVSVFHTKIEKRDKGIEVKGNFKILTEVVMVLLTVLLGFSVLGKYSVVLLIIGGAYLVTSKERYSKLKNMM